MTSWVFSSSSPTPITESSVEALTISVAVLTQIGMTWRSACGSSTRNSSFQLPRPRLRADSIWATGTACSAPRRISPRCAPQKTESAKMPAWARAEPQAEDGEDVEGREDQHQHRRPAHEVDIGAQEQAQRLRGEDEADADAEADGGADRDRGGGDLERREDALGQLPARGPDLGEELRPSRPQNRGKRRSSRRRPAASSEAGRDVERAGGQPGLDDAEGLDVDPARLEGQLGHGDRRGDRGVLEERDEGRAERRQHVAQHDRQADEQADLEAAEPDREAGIDDAARHAGQAGAEHLGEIGAGVEGERDDEALDLAEADAEFGQGEEGGEHDDEERRVAHRRHVGRDGGAQRPRAGAGRRRRRRARWRSLRGSIRRPSPGRAGARTGAGRHCSRSRRNGACSPCAAPRGPSAARSGSRSAAPAAPRRTISRRTRCRSRTRRR